MTNLDSLRYLVLGRGVVENQILRLVRGMGMGIGVAEDQMSRLVPGMGITPAQKTRVREARAQVNDEVDESLATVQDVKDEENLEALIQNDNELISETEDARPTSLEDEVHKSLF
jgi:hypothetical protein